MQKNNVVPLLLIVSSAVLMFSLYLIADLLGGMQRPYVPSIVMVMVLVAAVLLYLGIRKSTLDFRKNIFVVLIMFFSGILGSMYIFGGRFDNIYGVILVVVLIVAFLLCFAYIISQIADLSFRDNLKGIADKSHFFCLGIIVVFIACVFLANMAYDHIDYAVGHVELDEDKVTTVEGSIDNGEWVYAGSYEPTGEKGFSIEYPSLKPKLKFNINDIEWDGEPGYDVDSLRDMLNGGHSTAKIRLFNANGEVERTYETDAIIKGDDVIVNSTVGGGSKAYHEDDEIPDIDLSYDNITYGTLELDVKHVGTHKNGDDNYGLIIVSNRFKV